jgi:hypothetical protein
MMALMAGGVLAQAQGPIKPPPASRQQDRPQSEPGAPPLRQQDDKVQIDPNGAPPPLPIEQIIQKMAAKETEFREARGNYTYTQKVLVEDYGSFGSKQGEFEQTSEVVFTPEGKRYEKITYAPPSSLKSFGMSPEDERDLVNIFPFVFTTDELPKYEIEYLGRQQVDEIGTFVFSVRPKRLEPGQRYFQGTVWVDDQDLQIVRTYGKAVPEIRKKNQENLFPTFETWRRQIDGKYWFPVVTRADDVLHFSTGDVRMRLTVRYSNYKQFKSSTRIISAEPIKPQEKKPPQP